MLRLFHTIRQAMVDYNHQSNRDPLSGEVEMDEAYFGGKRKGKRGRGAENKIPVFGMMERNGKVMVEPVLNVSAETLTGMVKEHVRAGSRTYTDQFRSYNSLLIKGYEHIRIDHNRRFANGRAYINSIEGFWSYAKERLPKFHGVSPERFYFYIKEPEFRFNSNN